MTKTVKKDEIFYVGVRDPIEIRRSLLESSKDLVHALQRYEKFKEVRKERIEAKAELAEVMKDIKKLMGQLKTNLPETDMRVQLGKEKQLREAKKLSKAQMKEAKKAKKAIKVEKPQVSRRDMSELDKLESELAAIEQKLGTLA